MGAIELDTAEQRSEPRTNIGNEVIVVDPCDGRGYVICCIWDISKRGACLMVPPDVAVPHSFKILVDEQWKKAGVVWRRWSHVGIQFID
jgi:hypothetical protein